MGFIRKGVTFFVLILLILSLLLMNLFWTLNLSLKYESVKPQLKVVLSDFLLSDSSEEQLNFSIDESYSLLQMACSTNVTEVDANNIIQEYELVIPCSVVEQGKDEVIDYGLAVLIDDIYYQEYECRMIKNCYEEAVEGGEIPFSLLSQEADIYWQNLFYKLLMVSFVLLVAFFFLVEKKNAFFTTSGFLCILSAFPFFKMSYFINWLLSHMNFSAEAAIQDPSKILFIYQISTILFSRSANVFVIMLFIGVLALIIGYFWKIFSWISKKLTAKKENK